MSPDFISSFRRYFTVFSGQLWQWCVSFTCFKASEEQDVQSVAKNEQNKPGKCKQLSAPDDGV